MDAAASPSLVSTHVNHLKESATAYKLCAVGASDRSELYLGESGILESPDLLKF